MLNQSTLLMTRKNPTNFAHSRRQPPKYALPLGRFCMFWTFFKVSHDLRYVVNKLKFGGLARETVPRNLFCCIWYIQQTSQTFCTSQSCRVASCHPNLEIVILLLEEVRHWWESWEQPFCRLLFSCMFSLTLHLKAEHSSSYFQPAYLFGQCSPISIPKAEQSVYNVKYPSSASSTTNGAKSLIYSRWITSETWTAPSELSLSSQCTSNKFKPSSGFLQMFMTMSHRLQRTEMTSKGNWTPTCWDSTRGGNIDWDLAKSVEHVFDTLF